MEFNLMKIDKLFELYQKASKVYYSGETPILSDSDFDELTEYLLENGTSEIKEYINKNIFVDNKPLEISNQISNHQMISLKKIKYDKVSDLSEISKFFNKTNSKPILYSAKLDGMAIKVEYVITGKFEYNIKLIQSRGGLDLTEKLKNHQDINKQIQHLLNYDENNIHLKRGMFACEAVIDLEIFEEKYSINSVNMDYEYENARNYVAAILKSDNPTKEQIDEIKILTLTDGINPITNLNTHNIWFNVKHFGDLNMFYLENLKNQTYQTDGMVFSTYFVDKRIVENNYPLNMVAVKFPSERAKTKVIGFEWNQSKSGKLVPKILLEPVRLEGSTISKCAGYNYEYIKENYIGIDSIVEIEKSGDIIPVIKKVLSKSKTIIMPDVDYTISGKHCIAIDEEESLKFKFINGLKLLQLDGIGEKTSSNLAEMFNNNLIELFNPANKIKIMELFGVSSSNWKNFKEIYNIKSISLDQLIAMLQFDGVGVVISKKIALLITKKSNDNQNIPSHVLQNVCRGEGFNLIKQTISILKSYGITVTNPIVINTDTVIFEMTGNPPNMTKNEFVKKFKEKFPNSIHQSLTKNSTMLITDSLTSNSSKMNKARKYNLEIKLYSEFI